jgi:ketosteroid isomerase-like protein
MAHFMQDYLEKIAAGDWAGAADYYADDVVSHQAGTSSWSGTRNGKQAVLDWLGSISAGLDSMAIDHHALTLGEGHAVVLNSLSATRGDQSYRGNRAVVYHIGDDKIFELWALDWDQAAFDAFMG